MTDLWERSRGSLAAAGAGVLVALGGPTAAQAAQIVGSDLSGAATNAAASSALAVQTTQEPGASFGLTAGASGVITQVKIKHGTSGAGPGSLVFRILKGTTPNFAARSHSRLPNRPAPANATNGLITIVPRDSAGLPQGVPIAAGERLGIGNLFATFGEELRWVSNAAPGGIVHFIAPVPDAGNGTQTYSAAPTGNEILLQYTIEPDADGDAYGDESQDGCPADPALHGACTCAGLVPTIAGTAGNDALVGTRKRDVIAGLGGDDVIKGRAGNDIICGGGGNDVLKGGAGKDRLSGGGGSDTCKGGPNRDKALDGCEVIRKVP